jgi:ferredoxin
MLMADILPTQTNMKVTILEGCIACGVCESLVPEVFTVLETSVVNLSGIAGQEDGCREAAEVCPVSVIAIDE